MRSQLRSLTRDALIYGLGQTVGRMVTKIALIPVFTRVFIPAQFGAWDLVTTLATVLQILFISGLDGALNRYVYEQPTPEDRRRLVTTALAWRLGWSLAVCLPAAFLARAIAGKAYGDPTLAPYLRVSLLSVPCTLTVMFASDFLRMSFKPWRFLVFTTAYSVAYAVCSVVLVVFRHGGVTGALGATLLADGLFAVTGLWLIRDSLGLRISGARLRELLQVGLPFLPTGLAYWVIQFADRQFLARFCGYHEVGLYGAAARVALIMTFGVQAFTLAWGPFAFSQAQAPNVRGLFGRVFGLYAWGGSLLAVLLSCFAREILGVGTTRAYVAGQGVAPLLIFAALLNGTYHVFVVGIMIVKRTGQMAAVLLTTATLTLVLNYMWAKRYGMYGVGAATLLGYAATTVLLGLLSQRLYACPYPARRVTGLLLLAGAFAAAGAAIPAWPIAGRVALKAALFAAFCGLSLLFRFVSANDLQTVRGMISQRLGAPCEAEA